MPSFPGSNNALPGVYTLVETVSTGVSLPTGTRLSVIMGEGARRETLVASANGNGNDGLNPTFTSTNGQVGRYFTLSNAPIISNRTTLFKNGIPLSGIEDSISGSFPTGYDYRIDIDNGHIELQPAGLVDQGGSFYLASTLNVGNGLINSLSLVDVNAPTETWTVRCISARRDGYGNIVDGYARFIASGSISGNILDGYGNIIVWQSNGTTQSNTVLQFNITEGLVPFREGDRFTIGVRSGVLSEGDSLVATYIAVQDINDPEFFTDFDSLTLKHGLPSTTNRLSLGAQLAFANTPPGVWTCQCAPALPRRVSYRLVTSATGGTSDDDLTFALPLNVIPDVNSNINFFISNPTTGLETQIIPNKVPFYNPLITSNPSAFIAGGSGPYSYTVILTDAVVKTGTDGVITPGLGLQATLSSSSVAFSSEDVSPTRSIRIFDATNPANNGTFAVVSVSNGDIVISGASFVSETSVQFELIDSDLQSAQILFTDDLALSAGQGLRATVIDVKDASFYDAGWISAYESLEKIETDIVVPLPSQTISAIFQNGVSHVKAMSNIKNKKERVLFIGAISGLTPANVIGTEPAAVEDIGTLEGIQGDEVTEILSGDVEDLADFGVQAAYGNTYRVVYFYPDSIVVQAGTDRVSIDGFFIAAAAAGYLSSVPNIAIPLTNKTLGGFTILRDKLYRPITLEQLTASGITVLQPIPGGGTVIRGQTTSNSGFLEEREISIVFIRDRIAKALRAGFAGFIGQVEDVSLIPLMTSRAAGLLSGFINEGLITTYKDLKIIRDVTDPSQWNITVKVQPVYPVNFIFIRVGIGLI